MSEKENCLRWPTDAEVEELVDFAESEVQYSQDRCHKLAVIAHRVRLHAALRELVSFRAANLDSQLREALLEHDSAADTDWANASLEEIIARVLETIQEAEMAQADRW